MDKDKTFEFITFADIADCLKETFGAHNVYVNTNKRTMRLINYDGQRHLALEITVKRIGT